jgi:hypothetical protein
MDRKASRDLLAIHCDMVNSAVYASPHVAVI